MRRHLLSLLALVSLSWSLAAQSERRSDDTVAYTTATIRMREKPSPTARAIAILAEGTRVRLYHCSEGWCGVSVQRLAGYALEEFLTTQPARQAATAPAPTTQGRGYTNVDGEWCRRRRGLRMGSRLQGLQRSVAMGRSASAGIGRGRALIMGEWRSGCEGETRSRCNRALSAGSAMPC